MSRPHSRSHTKFNRQESKKIEDSLKQEEFELSVRMRRHEEIKKQWQRAYKASLEVNNKLFQSFNGEIIVRCHYLLFKEVKLKDGFFTDDEDDQPVPNSEKIISSSESKSSGDNSKVLTSDLLGFNEDWDLVEFVKPEKANPKNDKLWNQKLFYPSTKPGLFENFYYFLKRFYLLFNYL